MYRLLFILFVCSGFVGCKNGSDGFSGKSPQEAISTFALPPGFKIELVASEPLISDPVDMEIDEEGRMYVVEMHGYPLDVNNTGKVILLKDNDGDGKFDSRTVFAEGFIMPTGVMRWKKGVIVTDAPNVYYLEDSNGDGIADKREILLTGFALTNPQYLVNNPVYGLDNWIYLAHGGISGTETYQNEFGDTGSAVFYPQYPNSIRLGVNGLGKNIRFRPDVQALETTSSSTQFGHTFDEWGRHLLVVNDNHIYQEVIEEKYLKRNPKLMVGSAVQSLSDHGDAAEVYPITINPEHQLLTDAGVFTSACGITAYSGGAFPTDYNQDITFVCEPVSNIVHADYLEQNGATFTASRKLQNKEFLASTDAWFRPVNLYIGPDGALYVVDYYREIIEHPEWMSDDAIKSGKLYNGIDKGRIYRITADSTTKAIWKTGINLNELSDDQLIEKLADRNIWWRRNAQRLLLDRHNLKDTTLLTKMYYHSDTAIGRLHALWTLEGLGYTNASLLKDALKDDVAGIRENAIKIAELHLSDDSGLINAMLTLKNDTDPRVRFQLLCTLGSINTLKVNEVREQLLFENIDDRWMQIAALSALSIRGKILLEKAIANYYKNPSAFNGLIERLAFAIGEGEESNVLISIIKEATSKNGDWQSSLMGGLADGLQNRSILPPGIREAIPTLAHISLNNADVSIRRSARLMLTLTGFPSGVEADRFFGEAKSVAENINISPAFRAEAILLTAAGDAKGNAELFKRLIVSNESSVVRLAALQALNSIPGTIVSSLILSNWKQFNQPLKDAALNTFITEPFNTQRLEMLLKAIRDGIIDKNDLGWSRTVILMRDIPDSLKEQARALLSGPNEDRNAVILQYKKTLNLKGNIKMGETVYLTHCVICHKVRGESGVEVGPDLGTVSGWTAESILVNILDPNKSIAHGYQTWAITLKDGVFHQGIIISNTQNAIILRDEHGAEVTISQSDIFSKRQLGTSLMPADFDRKINKQQMNDLITFIKKGK